MELRDYLNIAVILVAIALIISVLLQAKGSGIGEMFGGGGGGGGGSYRTRRGLERTLFQLTIVLTVIFLALAALNVRAHN
jgi:preprotein translocase subunit SecG